MKPSLTGGREDGLAAETRVPAEQRASTKTFSTALPQVLATSAKNLLLTGYGMTLGFPTIVIPALRADPAANMTALNDTHDPLLLSEEQISWFSSINLICVPVGCMVSGVLTQPLGRKRSMMLVNIPFLIAWLMFHYASSVAMLYTSLVLTGLGGGLLEAPVLTYVAEITQPHLRGMLSATSSMCVILGVFIQFIMGTLMTWRTVAAVNVTFPLIAFVSLCFVPESPHWLISKDRLEDAERSLCWLRGCVEPPAVKEEFQAVVESLRGKQPPDAGGRPPSWFSCNWRSYTKGTFLKPYLLVALGFFVGNFSGMTTLQTYAISIFSALGAPVDKYVAAVYLGLVELAGTLVCVVLVHWTGKRPLTFVSTVGNGLCFSVVATYAYLLHRDSSAVIETNPYSWIPLSFLMGAAFLSHLGIRLLPWILIGEVYPPEVRGVASGASGSIGYIFGFAANKVYFSMLHTLTLQGLFYLYGLTSFLGCLVLYYTLPETEGRTLLEIEEHFAGKRNLLTEKTKRQARDAEKWAAANPALVNEDMVSYF
ncbi:facilitated trehalose transporter Tret1-like [Bacillus rossius redtenbacheri]|uniref:facilitated trehalose transporter Tret1-like n=1 Tax=Bacillus rossius redtenbacheri TaxID=93214 RepID=UPI002FDF0201